MYTNYLPPLRCLLVSLASVLLQGSDEGHTTTPSHRAERGRVACERATGDLLVPEGALLEFRDIAFVGGEAVERRRPVHVAIFHAERAVGVEDDGAFVGRGPRDEPAHGVVARAVAGGPEGGRVCGGEQREDELHGNGPAREAQGIGPERPMPSVACSQQGIGPERPMPSVACSQQGIGP